MSARDPIIELNNRYLVAVERSRSLLDNPPSEATALSALELDYGAVLDPKKLPSDPQAASVRERRTEMHRDPRWLMLRSTVDEWSDAISNALAEAWRIQEDILAGSARSAEGAAVQLRHAAERLTTREDDVVVDTLGRLADCLTRYAEANAQAIGFSDPVGDLSALKW